MRLVQSRPYLIGTYIGSIAKHLRDFLFDKEGILWLDRLLSFASL